MTTFDPSKTITLEPAAVIPAMPVSSAETKAIVRIALYGLLFVTAAATLLGAFSILQTQGTYWVQSQRNRYIAEMAESALQRAHDVAQGSATPTQWTQSALGRDDTPYASGSMWSIHVGDATVLGRGAINPSLGVRLHSPHGTVRFDPRGRSVDGVTRLVVDSQAPGDIFVINVAANGSIGISRAFL
jgi:hypothetical protein